MAYSTTRPEEMADIEEDGRERCEAMRRWNANRISTGSSSTRQLGGNLKQVTPRHRKHKGAQGTFY